MNIRFRVSLCISAFKYTQTPQCQSLIVGFRSVKIIQFVIRFWLSERQRCSCTAVAMTFFYSPFSFVLNVQKNLTVLITMYKYVTDQGKMKKVKITLDIIDRFIIVKPYGLYKHRYISAALECFRHDVFIKGPLCRIQHPSLYPFLSQVDYSTQRP